MKIEQMIPKIIHYCWFGGNPHNDLIKRCINSWKKFLPDYKIIEWNESNVDIFTNEFMSICYEEKKWAYVADYARLLALRDYGGIYLDTDMEVIKPFPEKFREYEFLAGEEVDKQVSCGIIGVMPNNIVIKNLIEYYDNIFLLEPIPVLLKEILIETNKVNSNNYFIAKPNVFYPKDYKGKITSIKDSYTIHHWEASWKSEKNFFYINYINKKIGQLTKNQKYYLIDLHTNDTVNLKTLKQINDILERPKDYAINNSYTYHNIQSVFKKQIETYILQKFIDPHKYTLNTFFEAINNPFLKNNSFTFYLKLLIKSLFFYKVRK
ncbi:glycosyltransferase family 32 protein [Marinilabilia rubra]|uniref:glycosyltransferase family 32 protein n=1 Tax=Marinilabilia rubra TaxID=2162893 RepID=UPI001E47225E|nr:glycosyltransferase [Marinilabilia rubra]